MEINLIRAIEVEIPIMQGNTFLLRLRFWTDKTKTVPTNLAGSSFILTLDRLDECRPSDDSTVNHQVMTLGNGLTISDTNLLTALQVLTLGPGNFKVDLTGTDSTGIVTTWITGSLEVKPRP